MKKLTLILLMVLVMSLSGCWITSTDGEHTGYITAIEKTGMFLKTWDVYIKTDLSSSQEDKYCLGNQDIIEQLKQAAKDKTRITLQYHDEFLAPFKCNAYVGIIDNYLFSNN